MYRDCPGHRDHQDSRVKEDCLDRLAKQGSEDHWEEWASQGAPAIQDPKASRETLGRQDSQGSRASLGQRDLQETPVSKAFRDHVAHLASWEKKELLVHLASWVPQEARGRRGTKAAAGMWGFGAQGVLQAHEDSLDLRDRRDFQLHFNKMALGLLSGHWLTPTWHSRQRVTNIQTFSCWTMEGRSLRLYTTSATSFRASRDPWAPRKTLHASAETS